MKNRICLVGWLLAAVALCFDRPVAAQTPATREIAQDQFLATSNAAGIVTLELDEWPGQTRLTLPSFDTNWVAAYAIQDRRRTPLTWTFNATATRLQLEWPETSPPPSAGRVRVCLEHAERTRQFADGHIVFSAIDADLRTRKIGPADPGRADTATWTYKPSRWGRYDVELVYATDALPRTALEVEIAGQKFTALPSTGLGERLRTVPVGRLYLAKAEPFTAWVLCRTSQGSAVPNLRALILRPAPEGQVIKQAASGPITLAASNAITHSTVMRYEPATNKNCLGFWINPNDWAEWEFELKRPGTFEVEVWQGCGKDSGGSEVTVELGSEQLKFIVEDTGHFQNFVPRRIGRVRIESAGSQALAVKPARKKGAAVMDVREIRLLPVEAP